MPQSSSTATVSSSPCSADSRFLLPICSFQRVCGGSDLADLRQLCDIVLASDALVLFLTRDLLTRPWCLIELYTAIKNNVPIVALKVCANYRESWTASPPPPRARRSVSSLSLFAGDLNNPRVWDNSLRL